MLKLQYKIYTCKILLCDLETLQHQMEFEVNAI